MLLSRCSVCDSKKLKFLIEQEARRLLSNLLRNFTNFKRYSHSKYHTLKVQNKCNNKQIFTSGR